MSGGLIDLAAHLLRQQQQRDVSTASSSTKNQNSGEGGSEVKQSGGRRSYSWKVVIVGDGGVGKTTFASTKELQSSNIHSFI
jgi:GTPase SAR1 family protein